MKTVFADSFYFFALTNPNDAAHAQAVAFTKTDCISFVVMQKQGITEALTGDHHFEQAGFTALLK